VRTEPLTILDAGHNPHGVRASAAALTAAVKLSHPHSSKPAKSSKMAP